MKISVVSNDSSYYGLQLIDYFDVYLQNLNIEHEIKIVDNVNNAGPDDIKIRFLNMPDSVEQDLDQYDLIFVDNGDEPTYVITSAGLEILKNFTNSFFVCNGYVSVDHPYHDKILPTILSWDLVLKYYTDRFYPLAYTPLDTDIDRKQTCGFINGQNRKYRNYFANRIKDYIPVISNLNKLVPDSDIEYNNDNDDDDWREPLGELCCVEIPIGTQNKFGKIIYAFLPLDEYYQYKCIAFPETDITNFELNLSEKILKCILFGAIPFPIGGAKICRLYNELGFKTAHDLLPQEMAFDHILNHKERLDKAADTLIWLNENKDILESEEARDMIIHNKINFYQNRRLDGTMEKLYNIIKTCQTKKN